MSVECPNGCDLQGGSLLLGYEIQGVYDRLTGPWRDAIGPIHPDDGDEGLGQ